MSIFKTNKFFRVIKHFILCLPLMFVLGVSLYAIVNPNAKDSYYGETINERQNVLLTNINQMNSENSYMFNSGSFNIKDTSYPQGNFGLSFVFDNPRNIETNLPNYNYSRNTLGLYINSNGVLQIYNDGAVTSLTTYYLKFDFDFVSSSLDYNFAYNDIFYLIEFNQYSYLNNAFEYGMYQFTQIGFGQFDFISFFNGIFTTNINNVYASFINDYINYYLFVELIYFAPWVFHMFIHFAYDLGDYFTSSFKRNRKDDD